MSATMNRVVIQPQTIEWHQWRMRGTGGSDAPVIASEAGLVKAASWMMRYEDLWKIKTGRKSGISPSNFIQRRGIRAEPLARAAYEKTTGILLSPVCGEMVDLPFIRTSLDGIDFDGDLIFEAKLANAVAHALAAQNEVVDYYKPQLAHNAMATWGMPETWRAEHTIAFASYDPLKDELLHVTKSALEYRDFAEKLLVAEKKFWDSVVKDALPCGPDWLAAATEYLGIKAELEQLAELEATAKKRLVELLGTQEKISGAGVSATRAKGAIDYDKILADHIKLDADQLLPYHALGEVDYERLIAEKTTLTPDEIAAYRKSGPLEYDRLIKEQTTLDKDAIEAYRKFSETVTIRVLK